MKGTGNTGKVFNDRVLAAKVRTLTLEEIQRVLEGSNEEYKRAVVLRMATSILPRINAFEGDNGEPMEIIIKMRDATKNS